MCSSTTAYTGVMDITGRGEGLGPVQDGETLDMLIHGIGRMTLMVEDPLKRARERGMYMGRDSVNHEAVRRNRPQEAHLLRD